MSSVRRSVLFSAVDRYVTQVLMIGTTMVMARILTPAETGLFFVANAVVLLAENFREFGVSSFIVQERTISRAVVRSAFTVTLVLSMLMGLAFYLGAAGIAGFYGEPDLQRLIEVATISILVIPFATPALSLLRRDLAFRALAVINITAAVANAGVTIVLGFAGFGPMSYMWGYVASNAIIAVVAFGFRPGLWMYGPSLFQIRRLLSFGAASCSVTLLNMAYEMLPRLAFGKILGFDAVGLYARAVTVCQLPDKTVVSALQPVVLPAMAVRVRAGGALKTGYLRGFELMSAIQWPMLIMLAILADPVVAILLGSQWGEVAPLVRLIAIGTMALAPAFLTYPVLVAAGRVQDTLYASLISIPPSIVAMIVAANMFGLAGVAASLLVIAPFQMLVALLFIRRAIGLSLVEMAHTARASALLTLGTAIVPVIVLAVSPTGFDMDWLHAGLAVLGGAVGWLVALRLTRHPLGAEILAALRIVAGRRDQPQPTLPATPLD